MTNLPSSTQILRLFGYYAGLPELEPQHQQNVFDRGTLVGKAANWLAQGKEPQWKQTHPDLDGYLDGYRRFLRDHRVDLIDFECEWTSNVLGYVVHPDQVCICRSIVAYPYQNPYQDIIEIKTGVFNERATRLQTAAQKLAALSPAIYRRFALHLPGDGKYRLYRFSDPTDEAKWRVLAQMAQVALQDNLPLGIELRNIMADDDAARRAKEME